MRTDLLKEIPKIKHLEKDCFFLIAGPCVVEGREKTVKMAGQIVEICNRLEIPLIFKASYRKANRSKLSSFSGMGDLNALKILYEIRNKFDIPVITDIHSVPEADMAAAYADVLQIPAFLCRQTDLLQAAAATEKIVNIKKGQFMSPESMTFAVQKIIDSGNDKVMITERGTTFGYQDLVIDFRGIPEMQKTNKPVILDVTHSLQQPNQVSGVTGGRPDMIETIAKAGIATGVDGIFIETHPDPASALSDGANMLPLNDLEDLLIKLQRIKKAVID